MKGHALRSMHNALFHPALSIRYNSASVTSGCVCWLLFPGSLPHARYLPLFDEICLEGRSGEGFQGIHTSPEKQWNGYGHMADMPDCLKSPSCFESFHMTLHCVFRLLSMTGYQTVLHPYQRICGFCPRGRTSRRCKKRAFRALRWD